MTLLRVLVARVLAHFAKRQRDADLHDEIQAHLDSLIVQHVREGMSLSDARAAAQRDFGGVEQIKETYRDQRGLPLVETVGRDLRHALRNLRRSPLFTTVAMLTFALGVGATTSVFVIVNSVLLRPLPYPNAGRVVRILQTTGARDPSGRQGPVSGLSDDQLRALRTQSRTLSRVSAYSRVVSGTLSGTGEPVRVSVARVSPGFFEIFGLRATNGRWFDAGDEQPGAPTVVVLSYRTWIGRFGGNPGVVGTTVLLDDDPCRIIGVAPAGFNLPALGAAGIITRTETGQLEDSLDFWMPIIPPPPATQRASGYTLFQVVASVREGATLEQAAAELNVLRPPLPTGPQPLRMDVIGLREQMVQTVKPTLILFQVAVLFVLLIACANVANLLLARASHRRRELAIRLALGASRFQAAREFIVECLVLAVGGSVLGGVLATVVASLVRAMPPGIMPRLSEVRVDVPALGIAVALSLVAGVVVGGFVAARVLRHESWTSIRGESASAHFARSRPSPVLVVVQVAAALILLAGAGLLLNSFVRLANRDLGFETNNVMTFRLFLPPNRYPTAAQHAVFWGRLVEALARLPGAEDAAAGTALPFQGRSIGFGPVAIAGRVVDNSPLTFALVTPGYFRALRVTVRNGREFTSADDGGAPMAAVVSQSFATHYFPSTNPLGQEVQAVDAPPARIVGVVPDAARSLGMPSTASYPEIYFSAVQLPSAQPRWRTSSTTIAVRTTGDPTKVIPGIRRTVAALDPGLPIYDMTSVRQRLSEALAESRVYSIGAVAFASTAAFLAVIGLYGVMSYSVVSRTPEWGIRMALGADAREIIRHVVGSGFKLTIAGILIGSAGAWLASRSLRTLLFGVAPDDPATLLSVAVMFFAVAGIACFVPARRASRVDPMVALRHE